MTSLLNSTQLNETVKIVTQRMSSIVQRKTIPQGFFDERGTQWNRKRARFNFESGRKRIGILIQPGVFTQDTDYVRFSFVQARILSMISKSEFVPAVSAINLSTLEKTMTQDLFSTFQNGFTENESTLTQLVGESVLGMSNTINSIKDSSIIYRVSSTPLLVIGSTNKMTQTVSKDELKNSIAGMIVIEGFFKNPLEIVVETESTPEFGVKGIKEVSTDFTIKKEFHLNETKYIMIPLIPLLLSQISRVLNNVNREVYPMYRFKKASTDPLYYTYLLSLNNKSSFDIYYFFEYRNYNLSVQYNPINNMSLFFPNGTYPSEAILPFDLSWYENSSYQSLTNDQEYSLQSNTTKNYIVNSDDFPTNFISQISNENGDVLVNDFNSLNINYKIVTSLPLFPNDLSFLFASPFWNNYVFQYKRKVGSGEKEIPLEIGVEFHDLIQLIPSIDHLFDPPSLNDEVVLSVKYEFSLSDNPIYMIPSLVLNQKWNLGSDTKWILQDLCLLCQYSYTRNISLGFKVDYARRMDSSPLILQSPYPVSSDFPPGVWQYKSSSTLEEIDKFWNNSPFAQNGFQFSTNPLLTEYLITNETNSFQIPLLILGGNTFQIIPTQTGTNKIDLIQPDTLTREFSTSEPCSYSNAILRFSNSGERFSVTLQVLGTIKRIE